MDKIVKPPIHYSISRKERMARLTQKNEWYCNDCNLWKPTKDFYKNSARAYGYEYTCKECIKARQRKRYEQRRINERKGLAGMLAETQLAETGLDTKDSL